MASYFSSIRTRDDSVITKRNEREKTVLGHKGKITHYRFAGWGMVICLAFTLMVSAVEAQDDWDFKYDGRKLPQTIIDSGGTDWQARPDETNGRPKYETIKFRDAQVGGVWSRIDDNSPDPNAPGASSWARGYLFGTDIYNQWTGRMTLVVRIKDLGTDSQKSVIDITNSAGNYWTLGHVAESDEGPAGWEFGQTDDGRNENGKSDVRTGGFNRFSVIRIVIIDDTPGDGSSMIRAWQNGALVYESERTDDISMGEFGEIAFRRTSGGGEQKMEIDWIRMEFGEAWTPSQGLNTPAGQFDGATNIAELGDAQYVDGAFSMDTQGVVRSVHDESINVAEQPIFEVDANGVPSQFNMFFLGFDVFRDMEAVGNSNDEVTGLMLLDKYSIVHTVTITGPGTPITGPGSAPQMDYLAAVKEYNKDHMDADGNPDEDFVVWPYFGFELDIPGAADGVARDIEVAVDWRSMTNAFQGMYIMDAFAGIHYVNNPEVMNLINKDDGFNKFYDIFKFKPAYRDDYAGVDDQGATQLKPAPYFLFTGGQGFPIARDLEVMVRFEELTGAVIPDSQVRSQMAIDEGIDVDNLFQPIEIDENRSDVSKPVYAPSAAVTNGYAILDGFGAVHTMLEDVDGNAIPAPWEDPDTGQMDPSVNAPYFANPPSYAFDIAVDIEVMPNLGGYCLLTRLGEVFVVNARGKTAADNFVKPGIERQFANLGFDAARDLTLVSNEEGKIVGMYMVDRFGTVHKAGKVPSLPSRTLYFPHGNARELEVSPLARPITDAN